MEAASPEPSTGPPGTPRARWVAVAFGLAALAAVVDAPASGWIAGTAALQHLDFFAFMGRYPVQLLALSIVNADEHRMRKLAGYLAPTLGSALLVTLIKYAVGRARPFVHLGPYHFEPWQGPGSHMNSLPSGDAAAATVLAVLMGLYFPRGRWVFWIMAAGAALARVAGGRHFLSDAIAGAALGLACVALARRWLGPEPYEPHRSSRASRRRARADAGGDAAIP